MLGPSIELMYYKVYITCRLRYWNIINELGAQCSVAELCCLNNLREVSQIKEDLWTHIQIKILYCYCNCILQLTEMLLCLKNTQNCSPEVNPTLCTGSVSMLSSVCIGSTTAHLLLNSS